MTSGQNSTLRVFHFSFVSSQGPVVQSPISTNPGLTVNKTYGVNPGLALIGL